MALEQAANYPIYFAASEDNKVANWRPLVHWAMAIPHMIVAAVLGLVAQLAAVISWFAILFTGNMPSGMADLIIMAQRYSVRTNAFYLGMTEQYPPFDFTTTTSDPGDYAVRLDVQPELENRNRLTVGLRFLWIIPIMVFTYIVMIGVAFVALAAWFAVLFTGAYPVGMRDFVLKGFRLSQRVAGYGSLLTDEYPPFELQ